ncbi:hypothetical protein CSUI_011064 [Cystoisospora suis]|uniref:Uncharacterized protein n=1 Tax=Cystoisospora suis TaxID=483139 RepID=A0A2C6KFC9_9APIC|nr:hypothetical protein CSUI_011064 [Cystoisospora suis]
MELSATGDSMKMFERKKVSIFRNLVFSLSLKLLKKVLFFFQRTISMLTMKEVKT